MKWWWGLLCTRPICWVGFWWYNKIKHEVKKQKHHSDQHCITLSKVLHYFILFNQLFFTGVDNSLQCIYTINHAGQICSNTVFKVKKENLMKKLCGHNVTVSLKKFSYNISKNFS